MFIREKRFAVILFAVLCAGFLLSSCGKSAKQTEPESSSAPRPVTSAGTEVVVPQTPQITPAPTPAETPTPEPVKVSLRYQGQEAASLNFMTSAVFQLEAVVSNGSSGGTWSSSDAAVASVDANGVVTCWKGGNPKITYTLGDASASCTINITEPKVGIYFGGVQKTDISLSYAYGYYSIQLYSVVSPEGSAVTWSSDDTSVASVSDNGLVSAHRMGTTTIHCKCGTADAACIIRVLDNSPNAAAVAPPPDDNSPRIVITYAGEPNHNFTMVTGSSLNMDYILYNIDPATAKVTWSISDPEYASVSSTGVLTAIKPTFNAFPGRNYVTLTATCGNVKDETVVFIKENW